MENSAKFILSDALRYRVLLKLTRAFGGEINRDTVPKMATQSLTQIKDFTIPNTQEATESINSGDSCVGGTAKKRISFRLSFSERQALEIEAKQKNMTLSKYIRTSLIQKNIAA